MTVADLYHLFRSDSTALLAALQPYAVDQCSGVIPDTHGHGFEEPAHVHMEERATDEHNPYDSPLCLTAWEEGEEVRATLHTFDTVSGTEIITWYIIPQETIFLPSHERETSC